MANASNPKTHPGDEPFFTCAYDAFRPTKPSTDSRRWDLYRRFSDIANDLANDVCERIESRAAFGALSISSDKSSLAAGATLGLRQGIHGIVVQNHLVESGKFAVSGMITDFEIFCRDLWFERTVTRKAGNPAFQIKWSTPHAVWQGFCRQKHSLRDLCLREIVCTPSPLLQSMGSMLTTLDRLRNCFVHNRGIVDICAILGTPKVSESEYARIASSGHMHCTWASIEMAARGKTFPVSEVTVSDLRSPDFTLIVREVHRFYKYGSEIVLTPREIAELGYSLQMFVVRLAQEITNEIGMEFSLSNFVAAVLPDHWPAPLLRVTGETPD